MTKYINYCHKCKSAHDPLYLPTVPRALLGTDMDTLPVHYYIYYGQPSAWMSREIMTHWFIFHLDPEIKAHYGENVDVILTLDNAGCHPPDLGFLQLVFDSFRAHVRHMDSRRLWRPEGRRFLRPLG